MNRLTILTSVLFLAVIGVVLCCGQSKQRPPSTYLIPEGYVGWVRINFRVKGAPALPVENDHYVFKLPPSGLFETSADIEYGQATDAYFYDCGETRRKLPVSGWGGGGMIWVEYNGWSGNNYSERTDVHEGFFVGIEEEEKKYGAEKDENYQPKIGPIDKSRLTCVSQ